VPRGPAPYGQRQAYQNEVGRQSVRSGQNTTRDQDRRLSLKTISTSLSEKHKSGYGEKGQRRDGIELQRRR